MGKIENPEPQEGEIWKRLANNETFRIEKIEAGKAYGTWLTARLKAQVDGTTPPRAEGFIHLRDMKDERDYVRMTSA